MSLVGALGPGARAGEFAVLARVPAGTSADVGIGGDVEAGAAVGTRRPETRVDHFAQIAPETLGALTAKVVDGKPQR